MYVRIWNRIFSKQDISEVLLEEDCTDPTQLWIVVKKRSDQRSHQLGPKSQIQAEFDRLLGELNRTEAVAPEPLTSPAPSLAGPTGENSQV